MIRTFLWFFSLVLALILSIPFWILCKLFPQKNKAFWAGLVIAIFVPYFKWLAGFDVERRGAENIPKKAALYVGNHQGLFDMVLALTELGGVKPFLAKAETRKIPILGSWMKSFDCVFIDRGNVRSSLDSIKRCEELLKSGTSIIIFPEGTRSRGHDMGEFKAGAFRCALKAEVPIVPFVIDGSYRAWEEKRRITPASASIDILPPIETAGMEKERTKHIAEDIEAMIKKALG